LQVYGTGNGPYAIDFMSMTASQSATHTIITGTAETGKTDTYLVTISSNPNSPIVIQRKVHINVIPNSITLNDGTLGVIISGESDFDVKNIDTNSVRLGTGKAKPLGNKGILINKKRNLLLLFNKKQTGIAQNDTQICLTGNTKDGTGFIGCDAITILPKTTHEQSSLLSLFDNIDSKETSDIHQFIDTIKD